MMIEVLTTAAMDILRVLNPIDSKSGTAAMELIISWRDAREPQQALK